MNFFLSGLNPIKRTTLALLMLALCQTHGYSAPASGNSTEQKYPDEVRGVWVWGATVQRDGAEVVAERLAQYHINKVFFLVKGYSGDVGFRSKLAPVPRSGKDLLSEVIAACHKRKIEVHAWFVFNADSYWGNKHPEDAMFHAGKPANWGAGPYSMKENKRKTPICPLSSGYRNHFTNLVQEVVDQYPVDGVHLDYIRYGHACYCFCPRHEAAAVQQGINLQKVRQAVFDSFYAPKKKPGLYFDLYRKGDPDVTGWVRLREEEINLAVKEVREIVKRKDPSLDLSASFMPEGGEVDDTLALCHYAQNYATAGAQLDYILPMTYAKGPEWAAQIALNAEKKSQRPVYSGLWAVKPAYNSAENKDHNESGDVRVTNLGHQIQVLRDHKIKGFVLFRYESGSEKFWEILP